MKMRNKVLALFLSLVMLLSVVPFSVFADSTQSPAGQTSGSAQNGVSITVQPNSNVQYGTGKDGTLTFKLDPSEVVAALKGEKSMEALLELLRASVDRSDAEVISLNELIELLPANAIISALLGENNENASALVTQLGGINALLQLVDEEKLILTANRTELLNFINSLENVSEIFYFSNIFQALPVERQDELQALFSDAITLTEEDITEDLFKSGMYWQAIQKALEKAEKSVSTYCNIAAITSNEAVKAVVSSYVTAKLESMTDSEKETYLRDLLTDAALEDLLLGNITESTLNSTHFVPAKVEGIATELLNSGNDTLLNVAEANFNKELFRTDCGSILEKLLVDDAKQAVLGGSYSLSVYFVDSFLAEVEGMINSYISTNGFTILESDINALFAAINANELLLADVINLDLLFATITEEDYTTLFAALDMNVLIDELMDDVKTLAAKLNKDQIKTIALQALSFLAQNVDLIAINDQIVAQEATSGDLAGLISFNYEGILQALATMIPSLAELAECKDGKLLSVKLYAEYFNANGEACTKDITVEFVFEGNMEPLRRLAAKLAEYVSINRKGNQLYIELTLPAVFTEAYASFLESENGTELRDSVLELAGKTGAELVEALEALTLDQILALLSKVDIEALYSSIMQLSYVEAALEKISTALGVDVDITKLQDLNVVLKEIADGVPTFEAVCNAVSRKINTDVMAVLKNAAAYADRNKTIQSYLDKLSEIPYIGKYLNDKSFSEILENYKNVEPVKAVSDYVARKVGVNLQYLLQNYDANELYQMALERAASYEAYYIKAQTFVVNALDPNFVPTTRWEKLAKELIPAGTLEAFLGTSLMDTYIGNGSFAVEDEAIEIDLGAISNRLLNFVLGYVSLNEQYVNIIKNLLPESTLTFGLHLQVNVKNLSKVTYLDEKGNETYSVFLPNGINPADFQNAPVVEFENFMHWANVNDLEGNAVTAVNGDVTLKPIYSRAKYTVTFTGVKGDLIVAEVENGRTLAETGFNFDDLLARVPSAKELGLYNGTYTLGWYLGETEVTADAILNAVITDNLTITYGYTFVAGSEFVESSADATISKDEQNNWTAEFTGNTIDLVINRENGDMNEIASITAKTENGVTIVLDSNVIAQIAATTGANSIVKLAYTTGTASSNYQHTLFSYNPESVYMFDLTVDGNNFFNGSTTTFAGDVTVTIPYDKALTAGSQEQKTTLYLITGNGTVQEIAATVAAGQSVTFHAAHFSEYFIVNEYMVKTVFEGITGTTSFSKGVLVPEGAVISEIIPTITNNEGLVIESIKVVKTANTSETLGTIAKLGDGFTMFDCPATVVYKAVEIPNTAQYRVVYTENGTETVKLFATEAEANSFVAANKAKITVPFGYKLGTTWVGVAANGTVYYTLKLELIRVTLKFGTVSVSFSAEDLHSFYIPAVTEAEGNLVQWKCAELGLTLTSKTTALQVLTAMLEKNLTEATFTEDKTPLSYTVYLPNGDVMSDTFKKGDTVTVEITVAAGRKLKSLKWFNVKTGDNGELTAVQGQAGKYSFQMPAGDVRIELVDEAITVTYKISDLNNNSVVDRTADIGAFETFTVTVPAGSILETAPGKGKLISFKVNADGSKVLTYGFTVTEEMDKMTISFKHAPRIPTAITLANGLLTTEESPVSAIEGLIFSGFAAPNATKFNNNAYQFATFQQEVKEQSLLWLWILIALVVIVALIAILYRLYINGKMKPNFFLRFITWLVSVFFSICLAISGLVLLITQGTTKKEDVNFEAFGMENPDEEVAVSEDAKPEEAAEEAAEEATEEATEEAAVEAAEEATEETTEE